MARTKGAIGKNKAFLLNRLQSIYGKSFDPILRAAAMASTLDELAKEEPSVANQRDSIASWLKIAEFTTPKLKSIEHTTNDTGLLISVNRKRYDGSGNEPDDAVE